MVKALYRPRRPRIDDYKLEWEAGYIIYSWNSAGLGDDVPNSNRLRSDFVRVHEGDVLRLTAEGGGFLVVYYDLDKNGIATSAAGDVDVLNRDGEIEPPTIYTDEYVVDCHNGYIRIMTNSLTTDVKITHEGYKFYNRPKKFSGRHCVLHGDVNLQQCPSNSIQLIKWAHDRGYSIIEVDPRVLADGEFVPFHANGVFNTKMRNKDDYSPIGDTPRLRDLTYPELKDGYVYQSMYEVNRTYCPTLREFFAACREYGMVAMIDNKFESMVPEKLALEELGQDFIVFTSKPQIAWAMRRHFSGLILLNPDNETRPVSKWAKMLDAIGGDVGFSAVNRARMNWIKSEIGDYSRFILQASLWSGNDLANHAKDKINLHLTNYMQEFSESDNFDVVIKSLADVTTDGDASNGYIVLSNGQSIEWESGGSYPEHIIDCRFHLEGDVKFTISGHNFGEASYDSMTAIQLGNRRTGTRASIKVECTGTAVIYGISVKVKSFDYYP